ncbi:MAG: pyrimidine 5'-nucleotidase [Shimia sp.]
MDPTPFAPVRHWVFDLDNTLYPPSMGLFDQIEARMVAYAMRELGLPRAAADRLRTDYWRRYGTTLSGLVAEHGIDPMPFLDEVHDVDMGVLSPDPALAAAIAALPGRRIVYTNGDRAYALRVLAARGLAGLWDGVFGIDQAGFEPKPSAPAYARIFEAAGIDPARGAMFEDDARNLAVPHALGMQTILVHAAPSDTGAGADHVGFETQDLTAFLGRIVAALGEAPSPA